MRPVNLDEALLAAVRLSGVSKARFDAVDELPPGELLVTIGAGAEAREAVVPCVAAKWNSSLADAGGGLEALRILFDTANPHGTAPTSSCQPGAALLVRRGACSLGDKALHAAASGAGAVLVCDTEPGSKPGMMGAGGTRPTIPGFMITLESGLELQEALLAGHPVLITGARLKPPSFYELVGGEAPIRRLVALFYRRVFSDPETWFREIFEGREEAAAVDNLAMFLIERWGGPDYYAQQRGPSMLIHRHMEFELKKGSAKRWLTHMEAAITEVGDLFHADASSLLRDFFRYQAHFIGYSFLASRGEAGPDDDHGAGDAGGSGGCEEATPGSPARRRQQSDIPGALPSQPSEAGVGDAPGPRAPEPPAGEGAGDARPADPPAADAGEKPARGAAAADAGEKPARGPAAFHARTSERRPPACVSLDMNRVAIPVPEDGDPGGCYSWLGTCFAMMFPGRSTRAR